MASWSTRAAIGTVIVIHATTAEVARKAAAATLVAIGDRPVAAP